MDEGWALDTRDQYRTNPEVNLPELIRYGKSKNVGIFVWLPWLTVEHHMDLFEKFDESQLTTKHDRKVLAEAKRELAAELEAEAKSEA